MDNLVVVDTHDALLVTTKDQSQDVKKIVEEHGGEMTFSSAEGGGTRVTMRFARDPLSGQRSSEAAD